MAHKDLFAVRRGVLKFRGFKRKQARLEAGQGNAEAPTSLTDDDLWPDFEQKGVDMRIGLDVAMYSADRTVDRIVLVSGDTDCIPGLKQARKSGLQAVLVEPGARKLVKELSAHRDIRRAVALP